MPNYLSHYTATGNQSRQKLSVGFSHVNILLHYYCIVIFVQTVTDLAAQTKCGVFKSDLEPLRLLVSSGFIWSHIPSHVLRSSFVDYMGKKSLYNSYVRSSHSRPWKYNAIKNRQKEEGLKSFLVSRRLEQYNMAVFTLWNWSSRYDEETYVGAKIEWIQTWILTYCSVKALTHVEGYWLISLVLYYFSYY